MREDLNLHRLIDRWRKISTRLEMIPMEIYTLLLILLSHDADNSTHSGILRCEDGEHKLWNEAMIKKLKSPRDLGSFKMVSHPRGSNVSQTTWAFKKKHNPDREFKKPKARFCVRGDQQIYRIDVFETYAPVVSWIMVRILMLLSLVLGLATQ